MGGLLFSQMITLFMTPVICTYLDELTHRVGVKKEEKKVPPMKA